MPLSIGKLRNKRSNLTLEIDGEKLNIVFNTAVYTPDFLDNNQDIDTADLLLKLLTEWDLEDVDGQPYPLELEAMKQLPIEFLNSVLHAITQSMLPNQKRSENSGSF